MAEYKRRSVEKAIIMALRDLVGQQAENLFEKQLQIMNMMD